VISVDCDEVLGAINPRDTVSMSGGHSGFLTTDMIFGKTDQISVAQYFNASFFSNTSGYLVVPFGDLLAGSCVDHFRL
jgi:hypothetical protein